MTDIEEVVGALEDRGLEVSRCGESLVVNGYAFDIDDDEWILYPVVGGALITCVEGTWWGAHSAERIAQLIGAYPEQDE